MSGNETQLEARLPRLFRLEGEAIVCGSCRRKWRAASYWHDVQRNHQHLVEHAIDHWRSQYKRPVQR